MSSYNFVGGLAKLLMRLLPCRNMLTFKLRALWFLIPAILVDIGVYIYVDKYQLVFGAEGPGATLGVSALITFVFCVVVDSILESRRQRRLERLQPLLADPSVPDSIKEEIAKALLGG